MAKNKKFDVDALADNPVFTEQPVDENSGASQNENDAQDGGAAGDTAQSPESLHPGAGGCYQLVDGKLIRVKE